MGFEPTPSIEDQNSRYQLLLASCWLESGALDRSAILTHQITNFIIQSLRLLQIDYRNIFNECLTDDGIKSCHRLNGIG